LIFRERSSSYLIVSQLFMITTVGNRWQPLWTIPKPTQSSHFQEQVIPTLLWKSD